MDRDTSLLWKYCTVPCTTVPDQSLQASIFEPTARINQQDMIFYDAMQCYVMLSSKNYYEDSELWHAMTQIMFWQFADVRVIYFEPEAKNTTFVRVFSKWNLSSTPPPEKNQEM